ncbi:hypothetical protein CD452_004762 [Escherichia coli]|nr:hypothetical protein [Escherichia coli]EET7413532.1 hypothetical protein [Escherichia coli]EEV9468830.1 hypothetical protein [Escherichia coli]EFA5888903.1 hypothetical protein [Escherichia coli]EFE6690813.1 hypothetical protein [Escherichia coli]
MAHDTKLYNSDDSAVFASRRGCEVKKALSLDYRHWIISVRLPYSERPPRPSRTFQQRIWR